MLLGITGKKGHGKDTLAKALAQQIPGLSILHFADPLKEMCREVFRLTDEQLWGEHKDDLLSIPVYLDDFMHRMEDAAGLKLRRRYQWANTPRQVLQRFGTDYVRDERPDYWMEKMEQRLDENPLAVVADVRFLNEAELIKGRGGKVVRVIREGVKSKDDHSSEAMKFAVDREFVIGEGDFAGVVAVASVIAEEVLGCK